MNDNMHDRETLPVAVPDGMPDEPETWDFLDAVRLLAAGQLPEHLRTVTRGVAHVDIDQMAPIAAYLTATRQHGVYRDHVRATGVVLECPDWCESEAHPRVAVYDADGPETALVCHSKVLALAPSVDAIIAEDSPFELQLTYEQWQGKEDDGRSYLHLHAEGELSAEQTRYIAAVLLDAADYVEGSRAE